MQLSAQTIMTIKMVEQNMSQPVDVVVMAAGKGTRMKSRVPKVLQCVGGQPLAGHVMRCASGLGARSAVVITGHEADLVEAALTRWMHTHMPQPGAMPVAYVRQAPQLGTGHAVAQALPALANDGVTLVLSGDVPLTQVDTLHALLHACDGQHVALLSLHMPDPSGYGRIVRSPSGNVQAIVEHKDATDAQRDIKEIYSGIMAVPTRVLREWVARLDNHNAQQEYYLTDVVKMAVADGVSVVGHCITDAVQVAGVNSPQQLAELERAYQGRVAQRLMTDGVRLADPARLDVRGTLQCGTDVDIDVNCVFEGCVTLGEGVRVGAHCVVANAVIEAGAVIHPFTHIDGETAGVRVGAGARVGPFARLRPGTRLGPEVHIGNFVEVKNSTLAAGAKANHLAYVGDATLGQRVNYGAGSITANYDGANKHRTIIEDDVHVGSNCVLVAPVTLGAGGTVAGGSTITKNTEAGALTVARGKQLSVSGWKRPPKKPKA